MVALKGEKEKTPPPKAASTSSPEIRPRSQSSLNYSTRFPRYSPTKLTKSSPLAKITLKGFKITKNQ